MILILIFTKHPPFGRYDRRFSDRIDRNSRDLPSNGIAASKSYKPKTCHVEQVLLILYHNKPTQQCSAIARRCPWLFNSFWEWHSVQEMCFAVPIIPCFNVWPSRPALWSRHVCDCANSTLSGRPLVVCTEVYQSHNKHVVFAYFNLRRINTIDY